MRLDGDARRPSREDLHQAVEQRLREEIAIATKSLVERREVLSCDLDRLLLENNLEHPGRYDALARAAALDREEIQICARIGFAQELLAWVQKL